MFVAPDPWYGGAEYWIRCTCEGQSEKVAVPLGKLTSGINVVRL